MSEIKIQVQPNKPQSVTVGIKNLKNNVEVEQNPTFYYSTLAKQWAVLLGNKVQGEDFSSKQYAEYSKQYAEDAQNSADVASSYSDTLNENYTKYIEDITVIKDETILEVQELQKEIEEQVGPAIEQAKIDIEQSRTDAINDIKISKENAIEDITEKEVSAITDLETTKTNIETDISNISNNAISNIETQKQETLNEIKETGDNEYNKIIATGIDSKADTSLSNLTPEGEKHFLGKPNITNCLTEVPQRIKADIVDGTLTVYAGSICIVPYGTDAPTYSVGDFLLGEANNNLYKIVDIQYAADVDYPVLDQPLLFYTVELQRDLSRDLSSLLTSTVYLINLIVNSTIEPSLDMDYCDVRLVGTTNSANNKYLVYDTTTNYVLSDTGHYSVGTLPVLVYNNREFLNVFDCVGFIGNTVYIHKNISMLMGIDKNPDGSQKNIEYTTDKLFVHTISPTLANYFYYVGFENGVSKDPNSKKLIFDNPNTTFVGSSSLGTFINQWKMWNFRTGKWKFYSSTMNDGVPFQVYNAIFGRLWFEDGKIIRLYLNPTGMLRTDEEKGITTNEQDSLSAMGVPVSGANLNSFRKAGTYYFSSSHAPTNIPAGTNGVLQVITNNERTVVKQIWFRQGTINSNDTQTWIRTYSLTNTETNTFGWSNWQLIPTYTNKNATNGFLKIGNNLIQWGQATTTSDTYALVTFPHAFSSSSSYQITTIRITPSDPENAVGVSNKTATNVRLWTNNGTVNWIAVGY